MTTKTVSRAGGRGHNEPFRGAVLCPPCGVPLPARGLPLLGEETEHHILKSFAQTRLGSEGARSITFHALEMLGLGTVGAGGRRGAQGAHRWHRGHGTGGA